MTDTANTTTTYVTRDMTELLTLYNEGKSLAQIGKAMGLNRNQVAGLINRHRHKTALPYKCPPKKPLVQGRKGRSQFLNRLYGDEHTENVASSEADASASLEQSL